jgi:hypothetical protein
METPKLYEELKRFMEGPRKAELAAMKEKEVAAEFNAQTFARLRNLGSREVLDSITPADWKAWQASKDDTAALLLVYVTGGHGIDLTEGTVGRARMDTLAAVNGFATMVTRIKSAAGESIPLWRHLGCEREANHGDVAWFRKVRTVKPIDTLDGKVKVKRDG